MQSKSLFFKRFEKLAKYFSELFTLGSDFWKKSAPVRGGLIMEMI